MKQTLLILLATITTALANPCLSLVQIWPNFEGYPSVTVRIDADKHGLQPDVIGDIAENGIVFSEALYDCPIYPNEWGNIMFGEINHGSRLTCGHTYSFRVRSSDDMNWSNWLTVTLPQCSSSP